MLTFQLVFPSTSGPGAWNHSQWNILLFGDKLQPVFTDFGLSKLEHPAPYGWKVERAKEKSLSTYERTTMYLHISSPDVLQHGWFTRRSDVFSLGTLLFEIFTGKMVFHELMKKPDVIQLIRQRILEGNMPTFPSFVPPDLQSIVQACWKPIVPTQHLSVGDISSRLKEIYFRMPKDQRQSESE